ncbi:MAG: hypothetical protein HY060_16960 [Proteobacteria bacterium]|nr:hypothetical protein [Pseudomonadota bacterium]
MTVRIRPSVALVATLLALSGCIDVECPAEFARPRDRERWCGHTGDVAAPTTYRPYAGPVGVPAARVTTTTTTTVAAPPTTTVQGAPPAVSVQPVPPPGGATQIR